MMRRVPAHSALGIALLLSCTPTEPCACPPARTSAIIYGEVRTPDGAPAAGAVLQYALAPRAGASEGGSLCEFDPTRDDVDPPSATADAAGRFRTQIFSYYGPTTRCLRVTVSAASGSAQVEGLLVPFRHTRPDSVGVVLTLR